LNLFNCWILASLLTLLNESQRDIIHFALQQLILHVDTYWPEIAEAVPQLETFFETSKTLTAQDIELVALLLSKLYYHLGEYNEALNYALAAGKLFDLSSPSEYVSVMKSNVSNHILSSLQ
jgi:26S proteasome regulatory subunit N2